MRFNTTFCFLAASGLVAGAAIAQPVEILTSSDYTSSGFFQSDYLRGEETPSTRSSLRVTSPSIFGTIGETAYFAFNFDPSAFSGPVSQAIFRVQNVSVAAVGLPDVSPDNPAAISLHSLTADPLASIDQSLASGPGSWIDFRNSQITTSSVISTTSVTGFGVWEWDITALVNEWIANGDANFAYTIGTGALLDPEGEAAVGFVNSGFTGLSGEEITARISIVPAPGAAALLGLAGLMASRRRRAM